MAVSVKSRPHFSISAEEFASWLLSQPKCWWFVDGDPDLTGRVDFPCPSDELADAIKRSGKTLLIMDKPVDSEAHGQRIAPNKLDSISDRDNRLGERTFLCCWEDSGVDWLLSEDKEAANQPS